MNRRKIPTMQELLDSFAAEDALEATPESKQLERDLAKLDAEISRLA
jgi:hypothetical protein